VGPSSGSPARNSARGTNEHGRPRLGDRVGDAAGEGPPTAAGADHHELASAHPQVRLGQAGQGVNTDKVHVEHVGEVGDVVPLALFLAGLPDDGPTGQTFSLLGRDM
jgi:hypothetical protein